jgi:hypothetical protein
MRGWVGRTELPRLERRMPPPGLHGPFITPLHFKPSVGSRLQLARPSLKHHLPRRLPCVGQGESNALLRSRTVRLVTRGTDGGRLMGFACGASTRACLVSKVRVATAAGEAPAAAGGGAGGRSGWIILLGKCARRRRSGKQGIEGGRASCMLEVVSGDRIPGPKTPGRTLRVKNSGPKSGSPGRKLRADG